jgi:hypothetical protein
MAAETAPPTGSPELAPGGPRVLISYSHDSPAHEATVLALSGRLRSEGINAILDQYEPFPSQGWIQWMKQQVLHARFVLVVCTETYCRRAAGEETPGIGRGAIYESQLIQQLLYNTGGVNEKFVPVVLMEDDRNHIPVELQRYPHYCLDTDRGYEDLYRLLTNQPRVNKRSSRPPARSSATAGASGFSKFPLECAAAESLLHGT